MTACTCRTFVGEDGVLRHQLACPLVDYSLACADHATSQGLDPATVALAAHADVLPDVGVEQTGGMTMVLTATDPRDESRVFTITCEGEADDESPLYLVCSQPKACWYGEEEWDDELTTVHADAATAAQVVGIVVRGEEVSA